MKIYKYQMKVTHSCERLVKVDRRSEGGGYYFKGTIQTIHGLVDVSSYLTPFWNNRRVKITTMEIVIQGISYQVIIQHYNNYTYKGLSRMAGKFAKECFNQNDR